MLRMNLTQCVERCLVCIIQRELKVPVQAVEWKSFGRKIPKQKESEKSEDSLKLFHSSSLWG